MDQRWQAGREDDAAELPLVPVEGGAALAECDRLQPGEPVAAARVAAADWQLVAGKPAEAADKDGRSPGETCPRLLVAAGRDSSDMAALWSHAVQDRSANIAGGVGKSAGGGGIRRRGKQIRAVSKS